MQMFMVLFDDLLLPEYFLNVRTSTQVPDKTPKIGSDHIKSTLESYGLFSAKNYNI